MREEEEWAARDEARRLEVEGLKAELEAIKRVVEGSGGVDGKLSTSCHQVLCVCWVEGCTGFGCHQYGLAFTCSLWCRVAPVSK